MTELTPYHLASFLGGQSDYDDKGPTGSFKSGYGINVRKPKDSISANGSLVDDLPLGHMQGFCNFIVPASDGNTYFFCSDGTIWRRDETGSYVVPGQGINPVYTDPPTPPISDILIRGAAEWFDVSGYTYLVWATGEKLHIKRIAGPGYIPVEPWNDVDIASTGTWPKTNLTDTEFHTMAIANGALQICNKNVMALVGFDLSYTNDSLELIPNNQAKTILERNKYAVIGCETVVEGFGNTYKDESAMFTWDGIGLSWNDKGFLKEGGLSAMIDTEIGIAQVGQQGKLFISDFNTPIPFRQIRGGGYAEVDAVSSYKGMALMGISQNTNLVNGLLMSGIYSIGRLNKNAPIVLNLEYQLTCDNVTSVKYVGEEILVAYAINGQFGVKRVDDETKSDWVYQSLELLAPVSKNSSLAVERMLNWAKVDLECEPLPPGTWIEVWYKIDGNTTGGTNNDGWIQANMQINNTGGGLKFEDNGKQNAVFYINQRARFIEVMVKGYASGNRSPEVNEINVYFQAG